MKLFLLSVTVLFYHAVANAQSLYIVASSNETHVVKAIDVSKNSGLKGHNAMAVVPVGETLLNVELYDCDSKGCMILLSKDESNYAQGFYKTADHSEFFLSLASGDMITVMSKTNYAKYAQQLSQFGIDLPASVPAVKVDPNADCFENVTSFCFGYFQSEGGPIDIRN